MLNYLEKFSLLNNNQYGFRYSRSTTQAVLDNFQSHSFINFCNAFDCIDHNISLSKLNLNGFIDEQHIKGSPHIFEIENNLYL